MTVDGMDVRDVTLESLYANIALVSQEVTLFDDTVAANIAYGRQEASQNEIEEAARNAAADGFIQDLPDGYQTRVGEQGIRLSGGQRQRVGIARALIQDPKLLLVDEPTASLDPKTSRQIMRLICELCDERGLSAIINIHDVALAKMFVPRVIGLKLGKIVFDGGPNDLTPDVLTDIYGEEDWEATIEKVDDEDEETA